MTTIINYLQNHWQLILALFGGAGGLSVVLETVLHKFKVDSKKLAYTLLHIFTGLTTIAAYFLANLKQYDVLPFYGSIVIFAETWHRFVISPAYTKWFVPFLNYLSLNKAQASLAATVGLAEPQPAVAPEPDPNELTA